MVGHQPRSRAGSPDVEHAGGLDAETGKPAGGHLDGVAEGTGRRHRRADVAADRQLSQPVRLAGVQVDSVRPGLRHDGSEVVVADGPRGRGAPEKRGDRPGRRDPEHPPMTKQNPKPPVVLDTGGRVILDDGRVLIPL